MLPGAIRSSWLLRYEVMSKKILIGILVSVLLVTSCVERQEESPSPHSTDRQPAEAATTTLAPEGELRDYFPVGIDTKWVYNIEIGEVEPLYYVEKVWLFGDKGFSYSSRGRFLPLLEENAPKTFMLEIRVKKPAGKQGPFLGEGVELEIEKDELGIFAEAKQVFWSMTRYGRFMSYEVVTYSPEIPGAPTGPMGMRPTEDGHSKRLIFFNEKPGTSIGIGEKPRDTLLFVGVDTEVPGYEGTTLLHFLRTVEPAENPETQSLLDKGLTEDTWFMRGKGLVLLNQKIDGKTSMVWTLVQFSK